MKRRDDQTKLTFNGVDSGISLKIRTPDRGFGRTFSPASSTWTAADSEKVAKYVYCIVFIAADSLKIKYNHIPTH